MDIKSKITIASLGATALLGGIILSTVTKPVDTMLTKADIQKCEYQLYEVDKSNLLAKLVEKTLEREVTEKDVEYGCEIEDIKIKDSESKKVLDSKKLTDTNCKTITASDYAKKRTEISDKILKEKDDINKVNENMQEFVKYYNYELYKKCGIVIDNNKIIP